MPVKSHHKGLVKIRPDGALHETGCSLLLKIEAAMHRAAGVDQKSELDGQIGFAAEIYDRLRRLVIIQESEVFLGKIAYKFPVLVGGDEEHIDLIHPLLNGEDRIVTARVRT